MIIDAHAHWGPWFFSMDTADAQVNLSLLDRYGIDLAVVSAVEAVVYDAATGNAALDAVLATDAASRLRGYLVVDPRDLDTAAADLQRYAAAPRPPDTRPAHDAPGGIRPTPPARRWVGVKIHSAYTHTPIASPAMAAAVRLATEHGLPVLAHTWGDDLLDLADLAAATPGARVIAGHMGAHSWRLVPEAARRSDRIWFEPCWSQPEAGRIRHVIDEIGCGRLLFGTDATLIDPALALGAIAAADLTPDHLRAVMGGNAAALLDLT